MHWAKLHEAADTARGVVELTWAKLDAIEKDIDLSPQGKRRQKAAVAADAITSLSEDKSLTNARKAVETMMERWREKTGAVVKKPTDIHESVLHQEIRRHVADLKDTERLGWIDKHAGDPLVFSALLTAPGFLSGLTETDLAAVKVKAESHLDPKIVEARAATAKALEDVEKGWRTATKLIAEKGGLVQDASGGWEIPNWAA